MLSFPTAHFLMNHEIASPMNHESFGIHIVSAYTGRLVRGVHRLSKKSVFDEAPSDEGKRSDVTGVNDSPVDCQSRDRNRRNDLSAKLTGGETQRKVS